jgi:hypothetical protein
MASATAVPLRVGTRKHNASPGYPRTFLKILVGSLGVVALGVITTTSLLTGVGWLLGVSLEARSSMRPVAVAMPPGRLALALPIGGTMSAVTVVASAPPPVTTPPLKRPVFEPLGALAFVVREASDMPDDPVTTGSLGPPSSKLGAPKLGAPKPAVPTLAALDVVPARRHDVPATPDPAYPIPLPPTRPRLAVLGPVQSLGIKPDDPRAARTAVYDITAQIVYLPNGERLEAHSGLGDLMDDPRSARQKNRGVTPPNIYDLTLRESLFHGVQAIRLTPVSDDDMFGRDGILAPPYMLGPSGQSNGCVSFKDYYAFLDAYKTKGIRRLAVISKLD